MKEVLEVKYKFRCGCLSEWVFQDEISLEEAFEKLCASFVRSVHAVTGYCVSLCFRNLGHALFVGRYLPAFTSERSPARVVR